MFHRIALAALLIASLAVSANAQKDTPKSTSALTWETIAAAPPSPMTTKRASVPGGWLVLVQSGDEMSLTFLPDKHHKWEQASPSDNKPPKGGDKPKFEDITKATLERVYQAELEQARAMAQAERAKALAAQKKMEEELKRLRDELEKTKKDKKPKKGQKGDQATDASKDAALQRKRIEEALGLAAQEQADKGRAIAEQARQQEAAARQEAIQLKKQIEAITQEFQKQLAETTKALEGARAVEKRGRIQAEESTKEAQRLKAELDLAKKEAERLKQLLDKKKK